MEKEANEVKQILLRLPKEIYKEISKNATEKRRSLNSEIIIAVENYLKKGGK